MGLQGGLLPLAYAQWYLDWSRINFTLVLPGEVQEICVGEIQVWGPKVQTLV